MKNKTSATHLLLVVASNKTGVSSWNLTSHNPTQRQIKCLKKKKRNWFIKQFIFSRRDDKNSELIGHRETALSRFKFKVESKVAAIVANVSDPMTLYH